MQNRLANYTETIANPRRRVDCATKRTVLPAVLASVFLLASSSANAVSHVGNPFTPAGATNFDIVALQGIDASTPTGKSGFSPQVNRDFEFPQSIGVSHDQGNGHLKDFGIGLYADAAKQVQSTGLQIRYNQPVLASSVTITIEDFDIKVGDAFFKTGKVEPSILLLGPGNSILASATPADIFANLVPNTSNPKAKSDVWDVSFSGLLNTLGVADTAISGFILYADTTAGERPNSDPYLLVSAGNPTIPEPSTYLLVIVAGALAILFHYQRRLLKGKAI